MTREEFEKLRVGQVVVRKCGAVMVKTGICYDGDTEFRILRHSSSTREANGIHNMTWTVAPGNAGRFELLKSNRSPRRSVP